MSFTYYGEYGAKAVGNLFLRDTPIIDRPTSTRIRLHTASPGADGTANEVSVVDWTNYPGFQVVNVDGVTTPYWNDGIYDAGSGFVTYDNNGVISWGTVNLGVGITEFEVTHLSITDQLDNHIYHGPITEPVLIAQGKLVQIASGVFDFQFPVNFG